MLFVIMLSVVKQNDIILSVIMLGDSGDALIVVTQSVVILSVILCSAKCGYAS
jgi:hypothetical protein